LLWKTSQSCYLPEANKPIVSSDQVEGYLQMEDPVSQSNIQTKVLPGSTCESCGPNPNVPHLKKGNYVEIGETVKNEEARCKNQEA
jgi:hypothetical protein